jgi:hypothetical protein
VEHIQQKLLRGLGIVAIENQARISSSVPGLGHDWGGAVLYVFSKV